MTLQTHLSFDCCFRGMYWNSVLFRQRAGEKVCREYRGSGVVLEFWGAVEGITAPPATMTRSSKTSAGVCTMFVRCKAKRKQMRLVVMRHLGTWARSSAARYGLATAQRGTLLIERHVAYKH